MADLVENEQSEVIRQQSSRSERSMRLSENSTPVGRDRGSSGVPQEPRPFRDVPRLRNPGKVRILQDIQAHVEVPDRVSERAHAYDIDPGRGVFGKIVSGNPP